MYKEFGISDYILNLSKTVEKEIEPILKDIDNVCSYNSHANMNEHS